MSEEKRQSSGDRGVDARITTEALNQASKDEEELRARFPDIHADERLKVTESLELPEVPQIRFEPPKTNAARGGGGDGDDTLRFGKAGRVSGRELRGMGAGYMIGISLVTSILVGTGLGYLLDRYLIKSVTPWGLIAGFFVGTISGFIQMIQLANRLNRDA